MRLCFLSLYKPPAGFYAGWSLLQASGFKLEEERTAAARLSAGRDEKSPSHRTAAARWR